MAARATGIHLTKALRLVLIGLCVFCAFAVSNATATSGQAASLTSQPPSGPEIPPQLAPWKPWVLHKGQRFFCPAVKANPDARVCAFSSRAQLQVSSSETRFLLLWHVYAFSPAILPHGPNLWPDEVLLDGTPAVVVDQNGSPAVFLEPGDHELRGLLRSAETPPFLLLAPETGCVELVIDGRQEPFPDFSPNGRLGLEQRSRQTRPEDSLEVQVFRLYRDSLPAELVTHVRLHVSGTARRITLTDLLPRNAVPVAVNSPLPLSFGPRGALNVQASPGRFDLQVTSRLSGPQAGLGPLPMPFGQEFWSVQREDQLREIELSGLPAIDPQTTDIPAHWRQYPAFVANPGDTLAFKELHRGGPGAAPDQLYLERSLWIDFDGRGLTVRDRLNGKLRQGWTLRMPGPGQLGRVTLDGKDQPIVQLGSPPAPGVELRNGQLDLVAESRYDELPHRLRCTGWDRDIQTLRASLNLPPGWKLLAVCGVDTVTDSWLSRWNLLDLFLTLLIVLAFAKVHGWLLGLLALVFFALAWHEPDAPQGIWFALLVMLALLRAFSFSERLVAWHRTRRVVFAGYVFTLLGMVAVALPFAYTQIHHAFYPQLEPHGPVSLAGTPAPAKGARRSEPALMLMAPAADESPEAGASLGSQADSAPYALRRPESKKKDSLMFDPQALVQTGPGLPNWQWRNVVLNWNGPAAKEQELQFWLASPGLNCTLSLLRVVLLILLLFPLCRLRPYIPKAPTFALSVFLAFFALCLGTGMAQAEPSGFPSQNLLDELRSRLLEPPDCLPSCVSSPAVAVHLDGERLRILFDVHAATPQLVPLPMVSEHWQPRLASLDESPAQLLRQAGELCAYVPIGVHRVTLEGVAPRTLSFQIAMPLASKTATVEAPGWSVQGIGPNSRLEGSLRLARLQRAEDDAVAQESCHIPPFLRVRRSLVLGLTWEVETTVSRSTPPGEPVVLEIPLLSGESVLTQGIEVKDGAAHVNLGSMETELSWRSRLDIASMVVLTAPNDVPWVETWTLNAAGIWDLSIEGLPSTRDVDERGRWQPVWHPWPGELLRIGVSRPEAAPGASMTIEKAAMHIASGTNLDEGELQLRLRASKGGRQVVTMPADAELLTVTVDDREVPRVGLTANEAGFPVAPGSQEVRILWRQPHASSFIQTGPAVHLGHAAVNVELTWTTSRDRWILAVWNGPILGPAVRFWSYLAVMFVLAFFLSRLPETPLRTWQWFLYAIGLSQLNLVCAIFAVAWLPAFALRREHYPREGWRWFGLLQIALLLLFAAGMFCLYLAVEQGLLGLPDMQIAGNGSVNSKLIWTQDRIDGTLPRPKVLSVPLYVYRGLMLAWALWLAASLLKWMRWALNCWSTGGILRKP